MAKMDLLSRTLLNAILSYDPSNDEEQGGFILRIPNKELYEFVPVKNKNAGTRTAYGLYTADVVEFNKNVSTRSLRYDLDIFASFHTHPKGMRAMPSTIDVSELFTSFPVNFIYAHEKELNRFDYTPDSRDFKWTCTPQIVFPRFDSHLKRTENKLELEPCRDE